MTLREVRNLKGLSQVEAAKFLSVPLRSYKRYENDKSYQESFKYSYLVNELQKAKSKPIDQKRIHKLNISIAGIGYVGLSSGLVLSQKANITMVDINKDKIKLVNNGISPIKSLGFRDEFINAKIKATDSIYAYSKADVVIVATPTDLDPNTNQLDTFSVESVVRTIRELNKRCLIVIKSTISIGLTEKLIEMYGGTIMFVPEFLREKSALKDAYYPSRIIFGVKKVNHLVLKFQNLVESCVRNDEKVMFMKPSEAEAVKLFSNTYLSMRIAFFNELDSFAAKNKLNSKEIIKGMGRDPRIGDVYNNPSIMFEGYCLPKDTTEMSTRMNDVENSQLITSITKSNESRLNFIKNEVIKKAMDLSNKNKDEIVIGIYDLETTKTGKSYRSSSALRLLNCLKNEGIKVVVYDQIYDKSESDFDEFIKVSDLIVSNNIHPNLKKYKSKLFSVNVF